MAATEREIQAIAGAVRSVAESLKSSKVVLDQTLDSNTAHAIDWTVQSTRDALEDNVEAPTSYTAAEISNALSSFVLFNSEHWDAGHGSNYELLLGETPIV